MDQQAVFDKVAAHLLRQGRRSLVQHEGFGPSCQYRGNEGLMCAVGCLIADEHYDPELEGNTIDNIFVHDAVIASGVQSGDDMLDLLEALQHLHDSVSVGSWPIRLREIAAAYHLDDSLLATFEGSK